MKIVVGLGNPGKEYDGTYHNVGTLAVRTIAGEGGWKPYKKLFSYALRRNTAFVLPLIFMNESGRAVAEALKKFRAEPADLVVIHDESDLPLGACKISTGRGSAGHKGVQSVMDALGSKAFARVRIGIRNPRERTRRKAEGFVLAKITPRDLAALERIFVTLAEKGYLSGFTTAVDDGV